MATNVESFPNSGQLIEDTATVSSDQPRRYPTILHVAVVSAIIIPLVCIPYVAGRRQMRMLRQQLEQTHRDLAALRGQVDSTRSSQVLITNELRRVSGAAESLAGDIDALHKREEETRANRVAEMTAVNGDIRRLLEDGQHLRTQATTLRALGMSLADIAAFMQEIELGLGLEKRRGVDRLRLLAMRMQSIPQKDVGSSKISQGPEESV